MSLSLSNVSFSKPKVVDGVTTLGVRANGIDFQEIIDALVEAKKVSLIDVTNKNDKITAKLEALSTLQTHTQALYSAAQALQNPLPIPGTSTVFTDKFASVQSSSAIPASQIVGVVAGSTATAGEYSLEVKQIATSDLISSSVGETSSSGAMAGVTGGNLIINGQAVPIGAAPTLQSLASTLNNYSGTTQVTASVIQVNTSDFRLNLMSTVTGTPITLSDNQGGALMASLNIASSGATTNSLAAQMTYNNLTVYRSTNQISDLIPGLTIQLLNKAPGTTLNITIENNLVGIQTAINNFVTAYNENNQFIARQKVVNMATGQLGADSILFNDPVLNMVYLATTSTVGGAAIGVPYSTGFTTLASVGITFDPTNRNNLLVDTTTLNNALMSNLSSVISLFGFNLSQTNTSINATTLPTSLKSGFLNTTTNASSPFTVTYSVSPGNVASATFQLGANPVVNAVMNADGTFSGPVGSLFEGFSFAYDGATLSPGSSISTLFTPTQGIADQLANQLKAYLDPVEGSFYLETTQYTQDQKILEEKIDQINKKVEKERVRLTALYSKVADAYALMEQQMNQIKNFTNTLYSNK